MFPYVFYTVEELSMLTSINNWTNLNVQLIGKIEERGGRYLCRSVGEGAGKSEIGVDFSLVAHEPLQKQLVRICGEIEVHDARPVVKAKIVRRVESLDVMLYQKALAIHQKYTPYFIEERPQDALEQSISKDDFPYL